MISFIRINWHRFLLLRKLRRAIRDGKRRAGDGW